MTIPCWENSNSLIPNMSVSRTEKITVNYHIILWFPLGFKTPLCHDKKSNALFFSFRATCWRINNG